MTDTEDPRGDAVARLHADLEAASTIHNDAAAARILARVQTRAAIELVEAVRDLAAVVALTITSTAPGYLDEPVLTEPGVDVPTEPGDGPEVYRVADVARYLEAGDLVRLTSHDVFVVSAAGESEGAPWLGIDGVRVWLDALQRDDRIVAAINDLDVAEAMREPSLAREPAEPELPIVAQHAAIDADEDDLDDLVPLAEGGADDDFDVTV